MSSFFSQTANISRSQHELNISAETSSWINRNKPAWTENRTENDRHLSLSVNIQLTWKVLRTWFNVLSEVMNIPSSNNVNLQIFIQIYLIFNNVLKTFCRSSLKVMNKHLSSNINRMFVPSSQNIGTKT